MGAPVGFAKTETPPEDDVCPVCFGEFVLPCRANCGHWFCGSCILEVWYFSSAFQACKCPMCCSHIKTLKPGAFPHLQDEEEARKVLKSIKRYNRLFVGGVSGFFLKLYDLPLLLRRIFCQMIDPNQIDRHVLTWRLLAVIKLSSLSLIPILETMILLGFLYMISPFKFIPNGVNVMAVCNLGAQVIVIVIKIMGMFQRRRSAERVRWMAAVENPAGS